MNYDCIVIGGGPAGLSAGLLLGRSRRRTLILDDERPRNGPAREAHSYFTRDGVSPAELRRIGREQLRPYASVEVRAGRVSDAQADTGGFRLDLESGPVHTRTLIMAQGVADELAELPGLKERWGSTVFHCPYCHAWELRDRPLGIVAERGMVKWMAAMLWSWSHDLSIFCTDPDPEERAIGLPLFTSPLHSLHGEAGVRLQDGREIALSGLWLRPPQRPRTQLARQLGCPLTETGYLEAGPMGETAVTGIFAAGDLTGPRQSLTQAVHQGAMAAVGVQHLLAPRDFPA